MSVGGAPVQMLTQVAFVPLNTGLRCRYSQALVLPCQLNFIPPATDAMALNVTGGLVVTRVGLIWNGTADDQGPVNVTSIALARTRMFVLTGPRSARAFQFMVDRKSTRLNSS